jgi:hypothetical protein
MLLSNPSEAVRSAEIVPLIRQRFEIVQQTDFGGTILHMLLSDIVGNFDPESEADVTIVRLLCYLEKTLIAEGVLPSDFTLIVARKLATPAARCSSTTACSAVFPALPTDGRHCTQRLKPGRVWSR